MIFAMFIDFKVNHLGWLILFGGTKLFNQLKVRASKVLSITLLALVTITMSACVSKPIYNVENRAFATQEILPLETIQRRIKLIGSARGWAFEDIKPGHMVGNVGTHKHNAKADIYFDQANFSIKYRESYNLREHDGTIHHRYNRWIELLERDIVTKIGLVNAPEHRSSMYLVIKEWSFWHASTDETPPSSKINPLPAALRRRLNKFGRAAAGMSADKVQGDPLIVFASRYGDAERSATILQEIAKGEDVSPMQFSLSVHNAVSGILSIGWKLKEFQASSAPEKNPF